MLLEICIGSLDDARTAADNGADRLELCVALELGGLTPSLGLIEKVIGEVKLPVVAMVRPRGGGFCYSYDEFAAMLRDAELALTAGAAGIVFGVLEADASIHREQAKQLVALAGDRQTVFHRAFDFVPDKRAALDMLIDLGVTRVLTTGGGTTAMHGLKAIRHLNDQAADRIEIMPGGGIDATNIAEIIAATGCAAIHSGCSKSIHDASLAPTAAAGLCDLERLTAGAIRAVDSDKVASLNAARHRISCARQNLD